MKTKREALISIFFGIIIIFLSIMTYYLSNGQFIWMGFNGLGIGTIVVSLTFLIKNKEKYI